MCGKYTLIVGIMDDRMNLIIEMCNDYTNSKCEIIVKDCGEICPNDAAPALVLTKNKATAMAMRWGFHATQGQKLVINARSETAEERSMFKRLVDSRRCALPAAGYFEWRDDDNLRHLISRSDGQPFYLAGLYTFGDDGIPRFVVLTRNAYGEHAEVHSRMPCLLYSKEEARLWISGALALENLYMRTDENLMIEAQESEQLRMTFDD